MKKIHLFLSLWLACCLEGYTQNITFEIFGVVTENGAPAVEHPVSFWGLGVNGDSSFLGTVFTNPNGFYAYSTDSTLAGVILESPRCDTLFGSLTHVIIFNNNQSEYRYDFEICDVDRCTAEFESFPAPNSVLGLQFVSRVSTFGLDFQHYWRFGDGEESNEVAPFHEFPGPGEYEVCLLVWDSLTNCERDFCKTIVIPEVGDECLAEFGYEVGEGGRVFFINHSEGSFPTSDIESFWLFGDSAQSNEFSPVHTYNAPGVYEVCLLIRDAVGCEDTLCLEVEVRDIPIECSAAFRYEQTASGNNIFYTDTSRIYDVYVWDFGDGTEFRGGPIEDHRYEEPGVYQVCLLVEDGNPDCRDLYCDTIVIERESDCVAAFEYEMDSVSLGIQFVNQSRTTDANEPLFFRWDFGDGNFSNERDPFHIYERPGDYEVCLFISSERDSSCFDRVCQNVWIGNMDCRAEFEYARLNDRPNAFVFEAFIPATDQALLYFWYFGDGTTREGERVVHQFEEPGIFDVCLVVMTPDTGCVDEFCKEIIVGEPNCDATFSYTEPASLERLFVANTISDRLTYTWFFEGSDALKFGPRVEHRFPRNGVYLVCLTVSDSVNCEETYCDSVYIEGGGGNCQANFTYLIEPGNIYRFINTSSASVPSGALRYEWSFGDGTTSNDQNPIHAFLAGRNYEVCLTITDATGCESTFCQNIGGYTVSGEVLASGDPVFNGQVFLIYHDAINETLTAVDTVAIQQGVYRFPNVTPGTYLVKAALSPSSIFYRNYLPTYLGDKLFWHQAISVVIASSGVHLPTINLLPGANPGGSGFIGGLISEGANKQGAGLENVSVLLLGEDGHEVSHTRSDEFGQYDFPDLAWGTYQVFVEIPGKISTPWIVTIGPDNPMAEEIDFEVGAVNITTDLEAITFDQNITLFPNPVQDQLNIRLQMKKISEVKLIFMNTLGQVLIQKELTLSEGNHDLKIDMNQVPSGVYILNIEANGQNEAKRIMVK